MKIALFLLLLLHSGWPAQAEDYVVIANPSLGGVGIEARDLRQVFLGSKSELEGQPVQPVFARSGTAHQQFASRCLGKSELGLNNYFRMLVFTGKGVLPKSFSTPSEIVDYVARTPGAIGYVPPPTPLSGVIALRRE